MYGIGTEDVVARTREFNAAFTLRDAAALQALMAPDYTFHYIDQSVSGTLRALPNAPRGRWPAELFGRLSNGPLTWTLIDSRVIGSVGIVVSRYRWIGAVSGQPFQFEGYMTDVWVRRHRKRQLQLSTADILQPSP